MEATPVTAQGSARIDWPPGGVAGPSCDPVTLGPRWAEPLGGYTGKWTRPGQTGPVARVRGGERLGQAGEGPDQTWACLAVKEGLPCSVQAPSSKSPDRLSGESGRIHWDRWGSVPGPGFRGPASTGLCVQGGKWRHQLQVDRGEGSPA